MTEPIKLKVPSFKEGENYAQTTTIEVSSIEEAERMADEAEQIADDIDRQLQDQKELTLTYGVPIDKEVENWLRRSKSRRRYERQRYEVLVRWLENQEGSYYYRLRQQRDEINQLHQKLDLYAKFYEPINTFWQQIQKIKGKLANLEKEQKELRQQLKSEEIGDG